MFATQLNLYKRRNALNAILLITMIVNVTNRKIVYSKLSGYFPLSNNGKDSQQFQDWSLDSTLTCLYTVTTCGTQNIVFIDNYSNLDNSLLGNIFNLDPHYQVIISFKFWRIDTWNDKLFEVFADQQIKYSRSFSDSDTLTSICQDATKSDEYIDISITIPHYNPTLWIILKGQGFRWGISDFNLLIDECAPGCVSCDWSECYDFKLAAIISSWLTSDTNIVKKECLKYAFEWTYVTFMETTLNLDTHIKITSYIRFILGNVINPTLTIKIDDQLVTASQQVQQKIIWSKPLCSHIQILELVISNYVHTNPTIKIRADIIKPKYDALEEQPYFGVPEYSVFIIVTEKIKQIQSEVLGLPFEGCQLDIPNFVEGCAFCVRSICLHCQEGWHFTELDQKCQPTCGDSKLVQNEECDDGNLIPYDGCYQCQYSCPSFCKNCIKGKCIECKQSYQLINGYCLFICHQTDRYSVQQTGCFNQIDNFLVNGYYQHTLFHQDNLKFFVYQFLDCNPSHYGIFGYNYNQCRVNNILLCKNQFWDICYECKEGFQLSKNMKQCVPVCNDGYKVDFELCDDGNLIQFDGCYKCQQSCQLECSFCVNQLCMRCIEGWDLIENYCLPNCGDGITVQIEQCDDGNQEADDGCYECQAQCSNCKICNYNNNCQVCDEHFDSVDMICLPICGDNYIEPGLEECDDGNQSQYDGCYNCQLECDARCRRCQYGLCQDICKLDELEIDGKCIKAIPEEKDIINLDECPKGCQQCLYGECMYCLSNYLLYKGVCLQIECGNGILEHLEECDDGNFINNDGCSNECQIENSWNCFSKNTQVNQCFSIAQASLDYFNQTKYYQYTDIDQFPTKDSFKILGLQPDDYNIKCNPKVLISQNEFRNIQYEFQIYFNYQIDSKPVFNIQLNETILDENNMIVPPTNISIELKVPKILTRSQLTASRTLKTFMLQWPYKVAFREVFRYNFIIRHAIIIIVFKILKFLISLKCLCLF
ncbi:unnamed protein product (macronuclear) [Paramecium tetraurelia]|uniref:Insulin-like growth factor binding protein, N-terminal n=1 Tax=Paramecium tetraurelia TaxID=5888 RepID=A0C272_PARTE|nr:uncharacterized protein GSPATT00034366001 [Paramecium tetraurelia]CAK64889.1 unnamed protein product [Paramecium tetraurelia]|eukprot:XP_001432286.1 hypothetical protein (macronuclear) [Paramecium tetraurelia strain d4-2]